MLFHAILINGEEIHFSTEAHSCVIGRSADCDFQIPHEAVSREHCLIEFINGDYFVTDLGSTNGVLIDGVKIKPLTKIPYQTFRTLAFGAVQNFVIKTEDTSFIKVKSSDFQEKASIHSAPKGMKPTDGPVSLTKTHQLHLSQKVESAPGEPKKHGQKKSETVLMSAIAILIILLAVMWHFSDDSPKIDSSKIIKRPLRKIENGQRF